MMSSLVKLMTVMPDGKAYEIYYQSDCGMEQIKDFTVQKIPKTKETKYKFKSFFDKFLRYFLIGNEFNTKIHCVKA